MAEKKFDVYQKKAVETKLNSVVSAGAGSGKTTVLSQRFLELIKTGMNVDEILTLTFTKKATVEMSSRIYKVLEKDAPEQAANFYKANIKTLDAYCSSVAKMGAHLFGISPDFKQDNFVKSEALNMALPFILEHRDNYAIQNLVKTNDYQKIAEQIFVEPVLKHSTVTSPIDFDEAVKKQEKEIIRVWQKITKKADSLIHQLYTAFDCYQGNRNLVFFKNLKAELEKEFPLTPELTEKIIEEGNTSRITIYSNAVNSLAAVRAGTGKDTVEFKEILKELKDECDVLNQIVTWIENFKIMAELTPLLKEFQKKINDLKRTTSCLLFSDISSLALKILKECPEIRRIEKNKYKAIMIDEFQDNNSEQRDMLFLLAENPERMEKTIPSVDELCSDKLFFVGDEKQSIYRFRGADVEVFRSLSECFPEGNLNLATNYRSSPALIAGFNTIFGGIKYPLSAKENVPSVFPSPDAKDILPYEAVYNEVFIPEEKKKELSLCSEKELKEIYSPKIHIALYDKNQKQQSGFLSGEEAEAQWVAEKIESLTSGENAEYKPGDIAILFRSYSLQPMYERALLSHNIPYSSETVMGIFSDGPVNDITALLKICVYQGDTFSYAKYLSSPFVNLSVEEINSIIILNEPFFEFDAEKILSGKNLESYANGKKLFLEIKDFVQKNSLTETISKIWYEYGYRYETLWNKTVEMYGKFYDILFELASGAEQQNMSLTEFIELIESYKADEDRLEDMDIPFEQVSGVRLMSIHKSKGLEFPVVFVCGSHKEGKANQNSGVVHFNKEFGISINSSSEKNYFFESMKQEENSKNIAELRRLAYVALTRAEKEVYITNGSYDEAAKISENPNSIFKLLMPVIEYFKGDEENTPFDFFEIPKARRSFSNSQKRRNNRKSRMALLEEISEQHLYEKQKGQVIEKDLPAQKYILPSQLHDKDEETSPLENLEISSETPFPKINEIVLSTIPETKDGTEERRPGFDFSNFGTIAHSYMEAAINGTEPEISHREFAGLENNASAVSEIKNICHQMMETFLKSPLGQSAQKSSWKKTEFSFRSRVNSSIVKGIVDLVFQNEDGTFTIVDYKTNQHIKPEIYVEQLSCYRQAVAAIMNVKNPDSIKCFLYYLRFGKEVEITEQCNKFSLP